jgi:hypothetical protein
MIGSSMENASSTKSTYFGTMPRSAARRQQRGQLT